MDASVRHALAGNQTIDLTTTGRRTGRARRIEIALHNIDGRPVISGIPVRGRTRAWLLNVGTNPVVTLHLRARGSAPAADVNGEARVVTDRAEREALAGLPRVESDDSGRQRRSKDGSKAERLTHG